MGQNIISQGRWTEEIYSRIQDLFDREQGPGLAAFDFDNTVIRGDIGEACMYYIALQGMLRTDTEQFWNELAHPLLDPAEIKKLRTLSESYDSTGDIDDHLQFVEDLLSMYEAMAEIDLEAAYRWTRIFFAGHSPSELRSVATYVFEHERQSVEGFNQLPGGTRIATGIRIQPEIQELIHLLKESGWDVRIITASPEPIVRAIIHHWNLPESTVRGMRLQQATETGASVSSESQEQGELQPIIMEPMTFGHGKVAALREITDQPLLLACGDSITDFELLAESALAIFFDRGNAVYTTAAREKGYLIQPMFL